MAKCVIDQCEREGGHINIRFDKYHADVSLCMECWQKMRDDKHNGTNNYDIEFTPSPNPFWTEAAVDYRGVRKRASVESIRMG